MSSRLTSSSPVGEQDGRVESPGVVKDGLGLPQHLRQLHQDSVFHHDRCGDRRNPLAKAIDRGLAADSARARGEHGAVGRSSSRRGHTRGEHCIDRVALRRGGIVHMSQRHQVVGPVDDALGKQKACGQLEVVSRGAHGDGDGPALDANLEGLFPSHGIGDVLGTLGVHAGDIDGGRGSAHMASMWTAAL